VIIFLKIAFGFVNIKNEEIIENIDFDETLPNTIYIWVLTISYWVSLKSRRKNVQNLPPNTPSVNTSICRQILVSTLPTTRNRLCRDKQFCHDMVRFCHNVKLITKFFCHFICKKYTVIIFNLWQSFVSSRKI